MDLSVLKNIGLSSGELKVFEILLQRGEMPAKSIIEQSSLKKGDCYNKLYDLKRRGLVEEFTKEKKKFFRLDHPQKIKDYIDTEKERIDVVEKEIGSILPDIISNYNLAYHKPGVQYFEGEDAVEKLTEDSLTAKTEILSYADVKNFLSSFSLLNKKYLKKRYNLGIVKKFIVYENGFNREYFKSHAEMTEIRYIDYPLENFNLNVQIYDDKISFLSFKNGRIIGIIIEDEYIAKLQRDLFSYIWSTAKE